MAHAAVVSLMHTVNQIRHGDGVSGPDENQLLVPLLEKLNSLLNFLEDSSQSSGEEVKSLERKIRATAYHAEDVFESCISDRLLSKPQNLSANMLSAEKYHLDLQKVMTEIDTIMEEVMKIKDVRGEQNLQPRNFLPSRPAPSGQTQTTMVGFAQDLTQIRDRLCDERQPKLQIIPIVGMGGMGKTTLTMNVFNDSYIRYRFDIRAWVTLFEQYRMRDILLSLLDDFVVTDHIREEDDELLKEHLYKNLKGRRYLIVVDDVRSIEVWNDIHMLFPDDKNGSRIIWTSRLKDVADYVNSSNSHHHMRFLNEEESWNLFLEKVFGEENCPLGLVDVGKKITENCKGLPLLIVVIGGLLSKGNKAKDFWEYVAENLSSIVAEEDVQCSERLALSYKHLPAHLKACFLYMGVFPENYEIRVSRLVKLWVAEGFLKPHELKPLEEVAQEYLGDLIDRNLILVRQRSTINGKVKTCVMHGLLRELCVRMAHKEEFLRVKSRYPHVFSEDETLQRRLSIHDDSSYSPNEEDMTMQSMSLVRSFIYIGWDETQLHSYYYFGCRLLRVLDMIGVELTKFPDEILQLVNLRYIAITCRDKIPRSIVVLKNLQTLVVEDPWGIVVHVPEEIFNMPQLRHLKLSRVSLIPDFVSPLMDSDKSFILENLETLLNVQDLGMTRLFLQKIPNVKKLGIIYTDGTGNVVDFLVHLQKLETLKIFFESPTSSIPLFLQCITSSPRLKKITLERGRVGWEYMKILGKLPNLEVLKLREFAFLGPKWIPTEGEFLKLKFLLIWETDLEQWRADSTHFPRLEHLILRKCSKLVEIPSDIGEILTLKIIEIDDSSPSTVKSAKDMLEEQRDQGNEGLEVLFHQTKERLYPLKYGARKIVMKLDIHDDKEERKAMKVASSLPGVESVAMDTKEKTLTVVGDIDPIMVVAKLRKAWDLNPCTYRLILFNMPQLRHLKLSRVSPLMDSDKSFILENLGTLLNVQDLGMTRHFLQKIPNLEHGRIDWECMTIFGMLPNLEVLKLREFAFVGPEWIPTEGEFLKLKFLLIWETDLEQWRADSTHFPRLEHLILKQCSKLVEIPSDIGEILTLKIIEIDYSSPSTVKSVKHLLTEQQCQGNDDLKVFLHPTKERLCPLKYRIQQDESGHSHRRDTKLDRLRKKSDYPSGSNTRSKMVKELEIRDDEERQKVLKVASSLSVSGLESLAMDPKEKTLTVVVDVDPSMVVKKLRNVCPAEILSVHLEY